MESEPIEEGDEGKELAWYDPLHHKFMDFHQVSKELYNMSSKHRGEYMSRLIVVQKTWTYAKEPCASNQYMYHWAKHNVKYINVVTGEVVS
jgi:hypothetical protein